MSRYLNVGSFVFSFVRPLRFSNFGSFVRSFFRPVPSRELEQAFTRTSVYSNKRSVDDDQFFFKYQGLAVYCLKGYCFLRGLASRKGSCFSKAWTRTKRGLEQSVDLNKAWTRTKRGLEQSMDLNIAWT